MHEYTGDYLTMSTELHNMGKNERLSVLINSLHKLKFTSTSANELKLV